MNRKIADCHAHIFPNKIAGKAVKSIGSFYNSPMRYNGTAKMLIESGSKIGVTTYLVSSSATHPRQVESLNSFINEEVKNHSQFIGLGSFHPQYENFEELDRVKELGLKGIKLHPDFQMYNIDDENAIKMYKEIGKRGLPILMHTGDNRYDASSPERLALAAKKVPETLFIAAHFGGYNHWYDVEKNLADLPNVIFDTSSTLFAIENQKAVNMIRNLGVDRFMFGSDFPMWDHEQELKRFLALDLTKEEQDKILWSNFQKLFIK